MSELRVGAKVTAFRKSVGKRTYSKENFKRYVSSNRSRARRMLREEGYFFILKDYSGSHVSCGDPIKGKGDYFLKEDLKFYEPKEGKQFLLEF